MTASDGAHRPHQGKPSGAEWLALYGREIDNVRAALGWAFSHGDDPWVAATLTIAAIPLWFQLSLKDECRGRVQQALTSVGPRAVGMLYKHPRLCLPLPTLHSL
jgi:predicted ATPase